MATIIELLNATECSASWRVYGTVSGNSVVVLDASQFAALPSGRLKAALLAPVDMSVDDPLFSLYSRLAELGFQSNICWTAVPRYSSYWPLPGGELTGVQLAVTEEGAATLRVATASSDGVLLPDGTPAGNYLITVSIRNSVTE